MTAEHAAHIIAAHGKTDFAGFEWEGAYSYRCNDGEYESKRTHILWRNGDEVLTVIDPDQNRGAIWYAAIIAALRHEEARQG